ncbi:hypothetical protein FYK55_01065 [Roseiconus nitratireducens]|uniref:Uncharacterized protein n=1 Tax=Roseiconus nitratireducens TaxID=2605748 RepID=A0A5M6DLE4_9BACT|nr:hypothetical protein [Roseiconus nitratireducens]KAA5547039.1 hypothetical protein FYK55_01065 [Roseiconus nitratireducens]
MNSASDGPHDEQAASSPPTQVTPHDQQSGPIRQFVSTIKNAEQQVGEHIIRALEHDDTVAVLTTVAIGPDGQQHLISAALDPERMSLVQEILAEANRHRDPEEPCLGYHCLIEPKRGSDSPE